MLVSIEVWALFTNIPQDEGKDAVKVALDEADDNDIPAEFLIRLLELVLK